MVLLGVGMGLYYPATTTIGMQALPNQSYGMGSAAISTAKSLGKLIGVLLFSMLFTSFVSEMASSVFEGISFENKIAAAQQVFRVAAGIAFFALLFSFGFKRK